VSVLILLINKYLNYPTNTLGVQSASFAASANANTNGQKKKRQIRSVTFASSLLAEHFSTLRIILVVKYLVIRVHSKVIIWTWQLSSRIARELIAKAVNAWTSVQLISNLVFNPHLVRLHPCSTLERLMPEFYQLKPNFARSVQRFQVRETSRNEYLSIVMILM